MKNILLLDYDHTLYPSTLPTLRAVDQRINLYIRTYLGFTAEGADALRLRLWDKYGTTLKGLEELHGVDRGHYCDFIHAIDALHLPPPDAALRAWLAGMPHPCYIFTNARMDWPVRGLKAMGLGAMLPEALAPELADLGDVAEGLSVPRLQGIFDIAYMDWDGKPNPSGYAKVDAHLRERHGGDLRIHFADDRRDNLESARARGWRTLWVAPHDAPAVRGDEFDRVVKSLTDLDPVTLS